MAGESDRFYEPAAVVVHVTEGDLNRILEDVFYASGGPVFSGHKPVVSRSISDFDYAARVSTPELRLHDGGHATLRFEIEDAEAHIGRIERSIIGRRAHCEDIDIWLDADRNLDVSMELQFLVADSVLRLEPQAVDIPGASRAFHLPRPSRCRNAPLPKRMLWWLGRPRIRRQLDRLDDKLLRNLQRSSAWSDGGWSHSVPGPSLAPRSVDTVDGGLRITLAAGQQQGAAPEPSPLATPGRRSFVAVSEGLLNAGLAAAFDKRSERTSRPGGDLAQLLRSDSMLTLVPGLREIDAPNGLWLNFRFHRPPRIELATISDPHPALGDLPHCEPPQRERVVVGVELAGIEMEIHREQRGLDELLGSVSIDRGRIAVVPYRSPIGGISFRLLDNEWRLSSTGLAFDEPLLAATIQELVFAELFETSYEPLAHDGFALGRTRFQARRFLLWGSYLLVELDVDAAGRDSLSRPARRAARRPAPAHDTASE